MQQRRWYPLPSPPKSTRHVRVPQREADRHIPFNPSGGAPAPPPERGFWAPRPGGEWKKYRGRLIFMPARKVPDDYLDPKKKINFHGAECIATPKPELKHAPATDAENISMQQPQRVASHAAKSSAPVRSSKPQPPPQPQVPPQQYQQPRPQQLKPKGLQARSCDFVGVGPNAPPLPKPSRPAPGGRTMGMQSWAAPIGNGYDHVHHHNGSLMAGGRYGRQGLAERGAPPRAQVQQRLPPGAFPPRYHASSQWPMAPAPAAEKADKDGICVIS